MPVHGCDVLQLHELANLRDDQLTALHYILQHVQRLLWIEVGQDGYAHGGYYLSKHVRRMQNLAIRRDRRRDCGDLLHRHVLAVSRFAFCTVVQHPELHAHGQHVRLVLLPRKGTIVRHN
ncbi:hypothetical protein D3C87_1318300 [compost metagenome]